jgi:glycosyltransferase involved in cell wall biosynthesis/tetratricopeptide (TPR) repeat protein
VNVHALIAFATHWGTKYGGINSFNADFMSAFGVAFQHAVRSLCVVPCASPEEIESARSSHVELVQIASTSNRELNEEYGRAAQATLERLGVFRASETVWLGHDRITGGAAIGGAMASRGRSAIIHHMSYEHYEGYAENSATAYAKTKQQRDVFERADILLAVGSLLRDALGDLVTDRAGHVRMLVPGLAEIKPASAPMSFSCFLAGRLGDDSAPIKQMQLAVAAFSQAQREANDDPGLPTSLRQPKLKLRGIELEPSQVPSESGPTDLESALKTFAYGYAQRVVNLHTLPFTTRRGELYDEMRVASVVMMPSWHEGFGLVAWEAIAAGVPLILSRHSGVFRLLEERWPGTGPGCVFDVDIRGLLTEPYFTAQDLRAVTDLIKVIAADPGSARRKAGNLRELAGTCTWAACAQEAVAAFDWTMQPGVIRRVRDDHGALVAVPATGVRYEPVEPGDPASDALRMPSRLWRPGLGIADSQLLRAEEARVPFDVARQPQLDSLREWTKDVEWMVAVRLITGGGGSGKTRLALELCRRMADEGWRVGLLDRGAEAGDVGRVWRALRGLTRPLLIVVDYAETRQHLLLKLLKAVLLEGSELPVRILLLARDGGEWWEALPGKDPECEHLLSGTATSGPFSIPDLYSTAESRRAAYSTAIQAYAAIFGAFAPDSIPDLDGEHFGRPLYIQMAALLGLHGERPMTAEGLTRALLSHEQRYWSGLLVDRTQADVQSDATLLMGFATLSGGLSTEREVSPLWEELGGVLPRMELRALFRALRNLYPGKQALQPLRPDLLGEALVARCLMRPENQGLLDAVLGRGGGDDQRRHALTVLARVLAHRADVDEAVRSALRRQLPHCATAIVAVAIETPSRLPALGEEAFDDLGSATESQIAGMIEPLMREQSVELAEWNCRVRKFLVQREREKFERRPRPAEMNVYAEAVRQYSFSLSFAGHNSEAAEAAALCARLLAKLPKTSIKFQYSCASGLRRYAYTLRELGRVEEALEPSVAAAEITRRLVEVSPKEFLGIHADALRSYAISLADAEDMPTAFEKLELALEIRRNLAGTPDDPTQSSYASVIGDYSNALSSAGRYEASLSRSLQALELMRSLGEERPDRYAPDYGTALLNTARSYAEVGEFEAARHHAQEAASLFRRLVRIRPRKFALRAHYSECAWIFCRWLNRETVNEPEVPDVLTLDEHLDDEQARESKFYLFFVRGCALENGLCRREVMLRACGVWNDLSPGGRQSLEAMWLCAAAFVASDGGDAMTAIASLKTRWQQFKRSRNGRVSSWMVEVRRRLGFPWPDSLVEAADSSAN